MRRIGLTALLMISAGPVRAQPPPRAVQASGPAPRPATLPVQSADAQVIRTLQGSVSAVFDPGAKTARVKLIETDDHGVEGVRTLKPGDLYRDGWRLGSATATEATLRKGKALLHVDLSRGWFNRPPPIQPAVVVQPAAVPGRGPIFAGPAVPSPAVRRSTATAPPAGRGAGPANNGLGLSNARVGGNPPAPIAPVAPQTFQGPTGPVSVQANPDGSRTVTSVINGQTIVTNIPANFGAR